MGDSSTDPAGATACEDPDPARRGVTCARGGTAGDAGSRGTSAEAAGTSTMCRAGNITTGRGSTCCAASAGSARRARRGWRRDPPSWKSSAILLAEIQDQVPVEFTCHDCLIGNASDSAPTSGERPAFPAEGREPRRLAVVKDTGHFLMSRSEEPTEPDHITKDETVEQRYHRAFPLGFADQHNLCKFCSQRLRGCE